MGASLKSAPRGRRRKRRSGAVMSEINVTPFVDVMLVLLIIFMVTAPMLTTGVAVDLPQAQARAVSNQDNTPVEISVTSKGDIYLGETQVTIDRLGALLGAIAAENVERRIYIRADNRLAYGRVMEVMAITNNSGFSKVALITDSKQQ